MISDEILILKTYVETSTYRLRVMRSMEGTPKTPTNIARDSKIRINHISNTLKQLKSKGLVECINENMRKGRLYRLTDTGKLVYGHL